MKDNRSNKAIEQDQTWDQFVRNISSETSFDDQWKFFETNFADRSVHETVWGQRLYIHAQALMQ